MHEKLLAKSRLWKEVCHLLDGVDIDDCVRIKRKRNDEFSFGIILDTREFIDDLQIKILFVNKNAPSNWLSEEEYLGYSVFDVYRDASKKPWKNKDNILMLIEEMIGLKVISKLLKDILDEDKFKNLKL